MTIFVDRVFFFLIFFSLAEPHGLRDLSSITRDGTCDPCNGSESLNHWTTREFPVDRVFKEITKLK